MLKVGDKLPAGTLQEFIEVEGNGCSLGPNSFDIQKEPPARRSRSSRCPVPSRRPARPSTCRAMSRKADEFKAAGVDEIWCVAVNDAFVMGAWGRDQKTAGKVRMMADGSADSPRPRA